MRTLSQEAFDAWRREATVVERDGHGEKVLLLADGSYLKIFRRKSWFSKTLIWPPAQRFADNATRLAERGIACPRIEDVYRLLNPYRSLVHYQPLPGTTLRQLLREADEAGQRQLLHQLTEFVRRLHDAGVYFRSLHPGNIVRTPAGDYGLIDIADLRCFRRALPPRLRKRNVQHLLRYPSDWQALPEETLTAALQRIAAPSGR